MKTFHAIKLWVAWSLAIGIWVTNPFLDMRYYELTQRLQFYPSNADSILIPIFGAFFMALIGLPIWFLICRKAFRSLSEPFNPFNWASARMWPSLGITLGFGLCILQNIQSAKHYHYLFHRIQNSDYSHISELAIYLMISSFGWAFVWIVLRSCFITSLKAGKEAGVHASPKVPPIMYFGWIAAFVVAAAGGRVLWHRTVVLDKNDLLALSAKEQVVGIWKLDETSFRSKNYKLESFRDFRVTLDPSGTFTAEGVPLGIFLNKTDAKASFQGTWSLMYHSEYHIDFRGEKVITMDGIVRQEDLNYGVMLEWENGHFVIDAGAFQDSTNGDRINIIRASPPPSK